MNTRKVVAALAVLLLILLLPWIVREIRIDSCLDSGGRWNYDTGACER